VGARIVGGSSTQLESPSFHPKIDVITVDCGGENHPTLLMTKNTEWMLVVSIPYSYKAMSERKVTQRDYHHHQEDDDAKQINTCQCYTSPPKKRFVLPPTLEGPHHLHTALIHEVGEGKHVLRENLDSINDSLSGK